MIKKICGLLVITMLVFAAGCTKVEDEKLSEGKYNEGTYFAYDDATKYSAAVYVNEDGFIKSVIFDAVYAAGCETRGVLDQTCTLTTKQALGDNYNMRPASPIGREWYEQVNDFAAMVIEEQGIEWLEFKYRVMGEDGRYTFTATKPEEEDEADKVFTDSVAGVTITADNLHRLISDVLEQAKK